MMYPICAFTQGKEMLSAGEWLQSQHVDICFTSDSQYNKCLQEQGQQHAQPAEWMLVAAGFQADVKHMTLMSSRVIFIS